MKRSQINRAYQDAIKCFARHGWAIPPNPQWDITDFGLGNFDNFGLTLINLAMEPEYCEKIMYARRGQTTPCHSHACKKEDIICRAGQLCVRMWRTKPDALKADEATVRVSCNGQPVEVKAGSSLMLDAGSRVTIEPGTWHEFSPTSAECLIGEVSTANDDRHDNLFIDPKVGRFPQIEEDETSQLRILSE